jgi:protoporphyrinogen IX oxidase
MYQWIKAFHIIAVIAWMAGMLYLPRLFVYHCAAEKGSVQSETFKIMERRLLRAIINPAMIATWLLGLWLAWHGPDSRYGCFRLAFSQTCARSCTFGAAWFFRPVG